MVDKTWCSAFYECPICTMVPHRIQLVALLFLSPLPLRHPESATEYKWMKMCRYYSFPVHLWLKLRTLCARTFPVFNLKGQFTPKSKSHIFLLPVVLLCQWGWFGASCRVLVILAQMCLPPLNIMHLVDTKKIHVKARWQYVYISFTESCPSYLQYNTDLVVNSFMWKLFSTPGNCFTMQRMRASTHGQDAS